MSDPRESAIAIVGMACRYPDAASPAELWDNVLAQRRAFRRIPRERLRIEDYAGDAADPDSITTTQAALLEGYAFDRERFRIAGSTYRSVDLAHWLALDVADAAFRDAGFDGGAGLPRETVGVLVGNTLTGELSRAQALRLRWPYVRRVLDVALGDEGFEDARRAALLDDIEARYKAPFAPFDEESLAGGLSNTIAGRICNHFDLKGGGYTVDGACASSLLAVSTACSALVARDLDLALAGGVDISLDPFELVGFSRAGALATREMRVYDARSSGFWPGEGCGFVVLMRMDEALAQKRRIYAVICGWGVASDGSGGITRPEAAGQTLALRRAYRRAGFGPETVGYFEGHGTGTGIGDAVELAVLAGVRAGDSAPPAAVGSIKAGIGHTKAAAGVAGLIKATMAVHSQIVPPLPGAHTPHPELLRSAASLRAPRRAEPWPEAQPLRAGVSAMGFGGIDTHVVIEAAAAARRGAFTDRERELARTAQDAELALFAADDAAKLAARVARVRAVAGAISLAELTDLAAALERELPEPDAGAWRAAVVASTPAQLEARLVTLERWLAAGETSKLDLANGIALGGPSGSGGRAPRIGLLFPGQGAPAHRDGGAWSRRFDHVHDLLASLDAQAGDPRATEIAQPAIVAHAIAATRVLEDWGLEAHVAVGHSLGELSAYRWAGALDDDQVIRIATARGRAMAEHGDPRGAMASLAADEPRARAAILEYAGSHAGEHPVVIAGLNGPRRTVISGPADAIDAIIAAERAHGVAAVRLEVSRAFHSPLVAASAPPLRAALERERLRPLARRVISTVTGAPLESGADLVALLERQVTAPVRFAEAMARVSDVDLWIEAGPGTTLSGLAGELANAPIVAVDAGGESFVGLLGAVGAAFALGAPIRHAALFVGRFTRPFDLERGLSFIANPCEQAPLPIGEPHSAARVAVRSIHGPAQKGSHSAAPPSTGVRRTALEIVRGLVAERAELPAASVRDDDRLLGDLHLNSIVVGELAARASAELGLAPPTDPTRFAGATVAQLARALEASAGAEAPSESSTWPSGVAPWVRAFTVRMHERARPSPLALPRPQHGPAAWRVLAPAAHPLAAALEQAFARAPGGAGVVACLPADPAAADLALLHAAARIAVDRPEARFVVVQQGGGGAAFARTLHLEAPATPVCVVDLPFDHSDAAAWVVAEALAATSYHEAHYDAAGRRWEPALAVWEPALALGDPIEPVGGAGGGVTLGADDVVLATGGGKGIGAQCALALGRASGARLALLGRSRPESDPALAAEIARFDAAGLRVRYLAADVTDAAQVREAVRAIESEWGPITAVLHAAGTNEPRPLSATDVASVTRALAPKVQGADHVLAAIDPARLRLFVAFGSIIGRIGLRGEADYGVANEWLARWVERLAARHPHVHALCIEWSVWAGAGMGERLGRVELLARDGVLEIPAAEGVDWFLRLVAARTPAPTVVVASRFGAPRTIALDDAQLPLRRFLERPVVHVPGVELVVEIEVSADTDPYLADHVLKGVPLVPAVIGLEAMAQVAMAVARQDRPPAFERVAFERPLVVPHDTRQTFRIAALVAEPGVVDVVVRAAETGFAVDHFRARCRFEPAPIDAGPTARSDNGATLGSEPADASLPLDPARDLYGELCFQSGRFRRVQGYRRLRATECVADLEGDGSTEWFGAFAPGELVLGDPGARDAAIHAIQACIPHAVLVPVAVERIAGTPPPAGGWIVHAHERERRGDRFVYDVTIAGPDQRVFERWTGLELKAMAAAPRRADWAWPLLAPYLERRIAEILPAAAMRVALGVDDGAAGPGHAATDRVIAAAARRPAHPDVRLSRSAGGAPQIAHDIATEPALAVSAAHDGALTLAVVGAGPLGCDLETVTARPAAAWELLLGAERLALARLIASEAGEELAQAATRVWCAIECLKKAGAQAAPLTLAQRSADGWVELESGPLRIATYVAALGGEDRKVVAILGRSRVEGQV